MTDRLGAGGVVVEGTGAEWFAPFTGPVLATVEVALGEVAPAEGHELVWEVEVDDAHSAARQALLAEGALRTLVVDGHPALAVDLAPEITNLVAGGAYGAVSHQIGALPVTIGDLPAPVVAQLVASFVVPLVASHAGATALHAAAAARDGKATLLVGPSGSGKSSLLLGLARLGWSTITEDVAVVDLDTLTVWPGPPWARVTADNPAAGAFPVLDRSTDKAALDLRAHHLDRPAVIERVVLLAPPGGQEPDHVPVEPTRAIAALPPHVTWLESSATRAAHAFRVATTLAARVPVSRLRVPVSRDWVDLATGALR